MARTSWRDRVELIAEVGLRGVAVGGMVWDVSTWDSAAAWEGLEPEFVALDGFSIERLKVERGRGSALNRNSAGTGELGLVWRNARGGHWSFRGTNPVTVGAELRVRAIVDGGTPIPVYRGTVRAVRDGWNPGRDTFRMAVRLVDRLADLGSVDLPEAAVAVGLDDLTHERILRVLELAGISDYFAEMGTTFDNSGVVHHQSSTFARNLLDEAMVATESEAGSDLLVNRDGEFEFRRGRWWEAIAGHTANPRWNATLITWANFASSDPATFAPAGAFATGQDLDDVRNSVAMARVGGSAITADDPASILRYGLRTTRRFDLTCRYDADVTAAAELVVEQFASRTNRIDAVAAELDPSRSSADLEAFVDLELGDRHALRWNDGDGELSGTLHLLGLELTVDPDHWRVTLNLWAFAGEGLVPYSRWGAGSAWGSSQWQ